MGKIYSWETIENRRIPTTENFHEAKSLVLIGLSKLTQEGSIYGGRVFGSLARDNASLRSDIDLLVVFETDDAQEKLRQLFAEIYEKINVGIEPTAPKQYS